jgi:hypothetical protein
MPAEDGLQLVYVQNTRFEKLQKSGKIFRSPGAKRDSSQVFRRHYVRPLILDLGRNGFLQRLQFQGVADGQELNWPVADDDMFCLDLAAAAFQIVVDRGQSDQRTAGVRSQGHQDVDIKGGGWLQIKRRPHGSADGVLSDDAVRLHLVDEFKGFSHGLCLSNCGLPGCSGQAKSTNTTEEGRRLSR